MDLHNQTALVTGGTRGLGLGVVEALVEQGATVTVVARDAAGLKAVSDRLGVKAIAADVTDMSAAVRIISQERPGLLVLNAGAVPGMGPISDISWETFSRAWETDVKATLYWIQAALNTPLAPGSRVLVTSSGAAVAGSPMSGGYAGAKRMVWLMANYANALAAEKGLGITFQTVVPRQMVGGTGVGQHGADFYSQRAGISPQQFLAGFGAPMTPRQFGDHLVQVIEDGQYERARAFSLKGDTGLTILEETA